MIKIVIKKMSSSTTVRQPDIKHRAAQSSKNKNTVHYIVEDRGEQVGFVSLDEIPGVDYLVLYELFITSGKRRCGYGTKILKKLEIIGRTEGYKKLTVNPEPLEKSISKPELIIFYKNNGFIERQDNNQELEKIL